MTPDNDNRLPVNRKLLTRLFAKIKISTEHFYKGDPCWEWQGKPDADGYGCIGFQYKTYRIHRFTYAIFVAIIPPHLDSDHLCRIRHCCNPAHIEPVTTKINVLRGVGICAQNAHKTRCPQGHPYQGANLVINQTSRSCRTCQREAGKRYRQRIKDKLLVLPIDHPDRLRYETMQNKNRQKMRNQYVPRPPRTHCRYGHLLSPENIVKRPNHPNRKDCLTCKQINEKRRYQENKLQKLRT